MSHYLTKEEIETKTAEINRLQENPDHCISLVFHRDTSGIYAEVPTHTRGENAMVAGADIVVGRLMQGDNTVEVKFRTQESSTKQKPLFTMHRFLHDSHGGTYLVTGLTAIPFPAWICNVTHDVCGEHPEKIFVYEINHRNVEFSRVQ